MTIYEGPIFGSSPAQRAACNKVLQGNDKHAMIAVSTKYLNPKQGGWFGQRPGACNKCMCIRVHGADTGYNPNINGQQKTKIKKKVGLAFSGQVGDRCAECEDEHIDVLLDRPFSYAPRGNGNNPNHAKVNRLKGVRGFNERSAIYGGSGAPQDVGTWIVDWQWAPCSYTHNDCVNMFKRLGYPKTYGPAYTKGV